MCITYTNGQRALEMPTVTARLDDWLNEEIRQFWRELGEGPSAGIRRVVEEWWTTQRFPLLEFRNGVAGRRAGVRGGPDVWEIVMLARDYGGDRDALHEHFGGLLSREPLDQALEYAERFPEPIEVMLANNTRMERLLATRTPR